jgi:hypothetical protein
VHDDQTPNFLPTECCCAPRTVLRSIIVFSKVYECIWCHHSAKPLARAWLNSSQHRIRAADYDNKSETLLCWIQFFPPEDPGAGSTCRPARCTVRSLIRAVRWQL